MHGTSITTKVPHTRQPVPGRNTASGRITSEFERADVSGRLADCAVRTRARSRAGRDDPRRPRQEAFQVPERFQPRRSDGDRCSWPCRWAHRRCHRGPPDRRTGRTLDKRRVMVGRSTGGTEVLARDADRDLAGWSSWPPRPTISSASPARLRPEWSASASAGCATGSIRFDGRVVLVELDGHWGALLRGG